MKDLDIQRWIERRLKQVKASGETNGVTDGQAADDYAPQFLRRVVDARKRDFEEILDAEIELATVRYSHRPKQIGRLHLRPIWCNSPGLYRLFADHEKLRFIERQDVATAMFCPSLGENLLGSDCEDVGIFPIPDIMTSPDEGSPDEAIFTPSRIKVFLDLCNTDASSDEIRIAVKKLKTTPGAFMVIAAQRGASKDGVQLLVAMYGIFKNPSKSNLDASREATQQRLLACIAQLKDDVDRITTLDSGLFRAEGLALTTKLLPVFRNNRVCAADKIALLIEHAKKLLTKHLIGVDFTQDNLSSGRPRVHFIRAKFQRSHAYHYAGQVRDSTYHPILDIYPAIYSEGGQALANFLVAHPGAPSWTKFALIRYFEKTLVLDPTEFSLSQIENENFRASHLQGRKIQLSDIFRIRRAFPAAARGASMELEREIASLNRSDDGAPKVDQFVFTRSLLPGLWDEINVSTKSEEGETLTKSIAAFIVEGLEHKFKILSEDADKVELLSARDLPIGIIVFESTYDDVYSDKDVDDLREICIGFSHLVRLTRHRNACFNFDDKLKDKVFESISALDSDNIRFGDFQYQINRLDAEAFHAVFGTDENRGVIARALCNYEIEPPILNGSSSFDYRRMLIAEFFDRHKHILEGHKFDQAIDNEAEILIARRSKFAKNRPDLIEFYNHSSQKVFHPANPSGHPNWALELLAAVPSNFTWESYRECLAGAFAERAGRLDPEFSRMNPGFSADQILMAAFGSELSQVVKLSSAQKLTREYDRYQLHVRYRITAAARIPSYALTIDSRGAKGQESGLEGRWTAAIDHQGFGSLISDLIASPSGNGRDAPPTLADYFAIFAAPIDKLLSTDECDKICTEIRRSFFEARNNWRLLNESEIQAALNQLHIYEVRTPRNLISYSMITKSDASGNYLKFRNLMMKPNESLGQGELEKIDKNSIGNIIKMSLGEYQLIRDKPSLNGTTKNKEWDASDVHDYLKRSSISDIRAGSLGASFSAADISTRSGGRTFGIVHGDLNGANLVWSDGFNGFFLIDFEHCHLSFEGVDQWRLAVNLLCNAIINWVRIINEKTIDGHMAIDGIDEKIKNLVNSIMAGVYVVDRFTNICNAPSHAISSSSTQAKIFESSSVARIIRSILESLVIKKGANSVALAEDGFQNWFFGGSHGDTPNRAEWHLMACLAAETEFLLVYRDLMRNRTLLRLSDDIFKEMSEHGLTGIESYIRILIHKYAEQRGKGPVELSDVRTLSRLVMSILLREAALAIHIDRSGVSSESGGTVP